jgi:hypothetical protein
MGKAAAAIPAAIGGAAGFLGSKKKYKDTQTYMLDRNQRVNLGEELYNNLMGLYGNEPGSDPHGFWGGPSSWTTTGDLGYTGADFRKLFEGVSGGGGFGGVGWSGVSSGGGPASVDMSEAIYNLTIPEEQRQRLLTQGNEYLGAQVKDQIREIEDLATAGGSTSSPAMMAMRANLLRGKEKGMSDAMRGIESDWFEAAGGRRHEALVTNAQLAEAAKARALQASIANAQGRLQAGMFNAGQGSAAAELQMRLGLGLLGMRGEDENRMMDRYRMLWGETNAALSPTGHKTEQPNPWAGMFSGIGAGLSMYGELGGEFPGWFLGRGGGGGGGG